MPRLLPPLLTTTDRTASRFTRDVESLGAGRETAGPLPQAGRQACVLPACAADHRPGCGTGTPARATGLPPAPPAALTARVNKIRLLFVLVGMSAIPHVTRGELPPNADAAVRLLYSRHAEALRAYVVRFRPDRASADDIVQETFIRAWRHLPQLTADDRPIRPWLFKVARNLLIDADWAARARPVTVQAQPAEDVGDDTGLDQILDRQLVTGALQHLSPAHRTVLVETYYCGTTATVARRLGIPSGAARSRLHCAVQALRQHLQDHDATAA
jgi:RNA polymerase sigma-70 factor, ECF subfamily